MVPDPTLAHVVNIPADTALANELQNLVGASRAEALAAIKTVRAREFATISRIQLDQQGEQTGGDTVVAITAVVDAILRVCGRRAAVKAGAPDHWHHLVGLIATGGYGRGEMCPHSDVDLLVLALDGRPPPWFEPFYAELNTLLWDAKFQLGISRRTLPELARLIDDDFVTATALLEWRPVYADATLGAALHETLVRWRSRSSTSFLKYKLEELAGRRSQAGASLFRMEPNLKTNPGCLRDVQLLRNAAFVYAGARNLYALEELDVLTREDLREVATAGDHLLHLRCLNHFHHGRKADVFQLADQVRVAKQYGYADVSRLRAVEHFMKDHYEQTLHVHQVLDLTLSRLKAKGNLGKSALLITTRRVLDDDFTAVQHQVYVSHAGFWRLPDAADRLLRMARLAQARDLRISLELQRQIRAHLHLVDDRVRHDPQLGRVFLDILGCLGRTRGILTDLHRSGFLAAYLPEFGNLTCHMQFDSYHQYTVDEHTLIAMGNLDEVATGRAIGLPKMRLMLPLLPRKDLLALSLLLHDMGKYMGRGHVARGALMVATVARRLGLTSEEEDLVYFLVDRHVSLSDASRMRDFREPGFLKAFTERIGSRERLDYLYCLTWCDARAVGEGILTGWQEAILGELRDTVAESLAGAMQPADQHERLVAAMVAAGVDEAAARAHERAFSGAYAWQVPPGEGPRHLAAAEECRRTGVSLSFQAHGPYHHLIIALPDRHALMADVCATLSGHGFDIIDLRTWISKDGVVLSSVRVSSIYPAARLQEDEPWQRLKADLAAVSARRLDAASLLDRRKKALVHNKPADSGFDDPAVKTENATSDQCTVVDVHVKDRVGLLSDLCRAISDADCSIGNAYVSTMGDVAVDVFYVQKDRAKLSDDQALALRERLIARLALG